MLDISFSELLLCFLVALVVLGPEKMPAIARGIGRWTGQARAYMRNLSAELDRESQASEFKQQIADARRIFNDESQSLKREFDGFKAGGNSILNQPLGDATPNSGQHAGDLPPPPEPEAVAAPPAASAAVSLEKTPSWPIENAFVEPRVPDKHV